MLANILTFAHQLLQQHLADGMVAIDGTAGNGHDTLCLAQCVGETGKVYAFDVQQMALDNTAKRLQAHGVAERVQLILAGHETLKNWVQQPINAAIFNFGYLPRSDKSITTQAKTSVAALQAALDLLAADGIVLAAVYTGHEAGIEEAEAIEAWASDLPQHAFRVLRYQFINQKNRPPYLLAMSKTGF